MDLLANGPKTTGELCNQVNSLDRCTVMKHLGLLVHANLVVIQREGRTRWNYLNPVPLVGILDNWTNARSIKLSRKLIEFKNEIESKENQ